MCVLFSQHKAIYTMIYTHPRREPIILLILDTLISLFMLSISHKELTAVMTAVRALPWLNTHIL